MTQGRASVRAGTRTRTRGIVDAGSIGDIFQTTPMFAGPSVFPTAVNRGAIRGLSAHGE